MNRIATASVIRGDGECQVFINGVVQAEIKRLQEKNRKMFEVEKLRTEMEMRALKSEAQTIRRKRDHMLAEKLWELNNPKPLNIFERIAFEVPYIWAQMIATIMSVNERLHGRRL